MRRPKSVTISSSQGIRGRETPNPELEGGFVLLDRVRVPDDKVGTVVALSATALVVKRAVELSGSKYSLTPANRAAKSTLYLAGLDGVFEPDPAEPYNVFTQEGPVVVRHHKNGELAVHTESFLTSEEDPHPLAVGPQQIDTVLAALADHRSPFARPTAEVMNAAMGQAGMVYTDPPGAS